MKVIPASENSIIVYFADAPSPALVDTITTFTQIARNHFGDALIDWIPSYISVLLIFDPARFDPLKINDVLHALHHDYPTELASFSATTHTMRVCYDPSFAPDIQALADAVGLDVAQVIDLHSDREYLTYAVGFIPGFAFLGELDPRICHPRHSTPRRSVAAHSVGIAQSQTGVYPRSSPGGWQIIGRRVAKDTPSLINVGDRVRFQPISLSEYEALLP